MNVVNIIRIFMRFLGLETSNALNPNFFNSRFCKESLELQLFTTGIITGTIAGVLIGSQFLISLSKVLLASRH